jgi:hypothetical protein
MIITLGNVKLDIKFADEKDNLIVKAMGGVFSDYLSPKVETGIPLVIRQYPDAPLKKLFAKDEFKAFKNYFSKIERRFPFGKVSSGWKKGWGKIAYQNQKGDGTFPGFSHTLALFRADRIAILFHNSFLLLINYEEPSGEMLILKKDFFDDTSTISLAIQTAVGFLAPLYGGMMLHACSADINGDGYVFLGESDAGKSAIAKLIGAEQLLADDGTLFFRRRSDYYVAPSPFTQVTNRANKNGVVPVKRFFFLVKDENNFIEEVTPGEAMSRILHNHIHYFRYFPKDEAKKTLMLVSDIVEQFPFYNLHFNLNIDPFTFFKEWEDDQAKECKKAI